MLPIEIRQTDVADLSGPPQLVEPQRRFDITRYPVVPPVQLDEIEGLHAQPVERPVHSAYDVCPRVSRQSIEIGNVLRVNLDAGGGVGAPLSPLEEPADQRFNAGVDVRAIECCDTCI